MAKIILFFCGMLSLWGVHGSDMNYQLKPQEVTVIGEPPHRVTELLAKALNELHSIRVKGETTYKTRTDEFLEENQLRLQEANNRLKETMEKATDGDLSRCQNIVDDLYSKIILAADKIFERLREQFDDCLSDVDGFNDFLTKYKSLVDSEQLYREDLLYWYVIRELADFFKKIRFTCAFQRKRLSEYGNYNGRLFDDYVDITKKCFNKKPEKIASSN